MKNLIKLCTVLAALALANPVNASGLLGESYFDGRIGYSWLRLPQQSDPDGWGIGGGLNYPLFASDAYALDWGASLSYVRLSASSLRARGTEFDVYLKGYLPYDGAKPFISVSTGWVWTRTRVLNFTSSDNSWAYGFGAGVEVPLAATTTLTPSIHWSRIHDAKDSSWSGELLLHNWFTEQLGGSLSFTMTEGPERFHSLMAGVTFRY